jgi:Cu(I)/Ag(I) efflux system membrane fusion protein
MSDPIQAEGSAPEPQIVHDDDVEGMGTAPPPGWRVMAIARWGLVCLMAIAAAASLLYYFGGLSTAAAHEAGTEYYCPMHPSVRQDHPGECPICSMTLVARPAGVAADASVPAPPPASAAHVSEPAHPASAAGATYYCPMHPEETSKDPNARCSICGMKMELKPAATEVPMGDTRVPGLAPVDLTMDRIQLMGMKTAKVTREPLVSQIRTVGIVSATEDGLVKVQARFAGWIQKLPVSETGQRVTRDQVVAVVYSPQVLIAEQELLSARRWSRAPSLDGPHAEVSTRGLETDAERRLELLGVASEDIAQLESSGTASSTVTLRSPAAGVVIEKNAINGMYFQPGTELFTIADLSRVWVSVDVYENEIARVHVGQKAHVQIRAFAGVTIDGTVSFLYPTVDSATRTLRVRITLPNADGKLRPGMFGNAVVDVPTQDALVIPGEALVDTGEHQYVFLAKEGGHFEPRPVKVGERVGSKVQVLTGVSEGDTVVTTGNFLLDSESQLRAVIEQAGETAPPATNAVPAPGR